MCNPLFRGASFFVLGAFIAGCESTSTSLLTSDRPLAVAPAERQIQPTQTSSRIHADPHADAEIATHSQQPADGPQLTTSDIVHWSRYGLRDEQIIDRIQHSASVFHLTAADENNLRDRGVSDLVIQALRDTARRQ